MTYAAYGNEPVRISGGTSIPSSSFGPARDPGTLRRLPPESRGHVLQADLRALGIRDFGTHRQFGHGLPVVPAPMELFWNDSVMQLARYPNAGAIAIGAIIDPGSMPRVGDYSKPGRTVPLHGSASCALGGRAGRLAPGVLQSRFCR